MRNSIYIIIGFVSALIEAAVHISLYGIGIEFAVVSIIGLSLFFAGNKSAGTYIMLAGAIVLDLFSPYRFGLFLTTTVIILYLAQTLFSRNIDPGNPVMTFFMMLGAFIFLHFFEFLGDPIITVLVATAVLNALCATACTLLWVRIPIFHDASIIVSKDVRIR
ncbi:hypothetical protein COS66_03000 [Candidatus Berkelbacteria bacterium CG06_land_8_20_14_3_00_43_10]|uniref:Rod shape-determining protein MreD n=1 Tax=Candidatus Berkelbacteria bacterium CG10_big_fil_rev_8_21_14_0_10_43_14 TaxID=1974515 RepID=A0A2M6R7Z1_9BACT|nr:MAG: hypothetical protein AUK41_02940 [Candidatus Berkelbacteria bacterium CG2_30_43_20]PIS06617.1 MAG: hypothetical protein COT79_03755 [Candidatus Berkelbacteria bacterium CG10_big_fil_rev_8_21_14_0_10_43_14]PIU87065.1 MAG: hypothetical protein COS66_03000 [Candidatus Berkelbacteria bacterium CG06_land_8_20_14_3_00_43_10]